MEAIFTKTIHHAYVIDMSLIFYFVLPHSPSFLESPNYRIEFLDTPIEYENAVENSHEKKKAQRRFAAQEF